MRHLKLRYHAVPAVAAFLGLSAPAFAQTTNTVTTGLYPGGATAVSETYGDWAVNCGQRDNAKNCAVVHQQFENQRGQRVLAVELTVKGSDKIEGTIVVPFGISFEPGVTLQIGDGPNSPPFKFRTCVPGGCTVAVSLDSKALDAMRKNNQLKINATAADANKPVSFTVSLAGFVPAYQRASALAK